MSRARYSLSILAARSLLYGTMFIGFTGIIGILFGVPALTKWGEEFPSMALPTSIVIIIHSIVGLILTRSPEIRANQDVEILREELRCKP